MYKYADHTLDLYLHWLFAVVFHHVFFSNVTELEASLIKSAVLIQNKLQW